ncbi:MAG: lipocalin family protein [Bacteroidales bacterium]|nr:lipocalin family protein [Bacteroidales bacterium]
MKKAFKVLSIVCFVAALFTMTSCTKSQEDLIVGTWKVSNVVSEPENPFVLMMVGTTFTFNADNTCSTSTTFMGMTNVQNGTYTIADGKLSMTLTDEDGSDTEVFDIKKLDKSDLSLYFEDKDTDFDGNPITMKITLELARQ